MHFSLYLPAVLAAATVSVASAIEIPALTKERILEIQKTHAETGSGALKFAEPHSVSVNPSTDGDWDPKTKTWTIVVESPGATSLNFGFPKFELPKGAKVKIENVHPDKASVKPIIVDASLKTKDKQLWTPIVGSDKVQITLTYGDDKDRKDGPEDDIHLGFVNVGFVPIGGDKSGGCNVDVVCPEREGWEAEIPSVGGVTFGGSLFCTGVMINNMEQDQTPFFLTATHCGINSGNAGSLVPYWNYETSTCGGLPDGDLNQFTLGGADFLASTSAYDGTLVRLINDPDPAYGVTFSGWDNTPEAYQVTPGVCIHHPSGDEKRISFEFDDMQTTSYGGSNPSPTQSHVKVIDWDIGTTEPGSSGSPLYNGNNRIIGQLHGGSAACGNDLPDWYGRFSQSYANANWGQWLDPNNVLGGEFGGIDTYDPYAFPTISPAPTPVPPSTPAPTVCQGPDFGLELLTDNYGGETYWSLTNQDTGDIAVFGSSYSSNQLYTVEQCIQENTCYEFTIYDSYGDGICCGYGQGYYVVTLDGEEVGSGGEFGFSESVDFCTGEHSPTPTPAPTVCQGPDFGLELLTDDYASETFWSLTNQDTGDLVVSGTGYSNNELYTVEQCIQENTCYEFTIFDSWGDGICCGYGEGYYVVTLDGEEVGSGGEFGSSESVEFCTEDSPEPICVDSDLSVPYQGDTYSCNQIALGGCSLAASHCPLGCDACDAYGCEDSEVPWILFGQTFTCGQLAGIDDPGVIVAYCNTYNLFSTCRSTCAYC